MLLGSVLVRDITNPQPGDVDVEFMFRRLGEIRRFAGHPRALMVRQHQLLVSLLAEEAGEGPEVVAWARHHDDHEFATGDIPTPMQKAIGMERIRSIQARWDLAICAALGMAPPTERVRRAVAVVDAVALAMEWRWCLERDVAELGVSEKVAELSQYRCHLDEVLAQ